MEEVSPVNAVDKIHHSMNRNSQCTELRMSKKKIRYQMECKITIKQ